MRSIFVAALALCAAAAAAEGAAGAYGAAGAAGRAEAEAALAGLRTVLEESFDVEHGALINRRLATRTAMRTTRAVDAQATKLLYPHTPKTGGTSLSDFFRHLFARRPVEGGLSPTRQLPKAKSTRYRLNCADFRSHRDYYEEHFAVEEAVDARRRCDESDTIIVATVREPLSWLHSAYGHKRMHRNCISRTGAKRGLNPARVGLRNMTDDGCDFVSWDNFQTCWLLTHIGGGTITKPVGGPPVAELCGRAALDVGLLREIDVIIFTRDLSDAPLWLPARLGLSNVGVSMHHKRRQEYEFPESPEAAFEELVGQRFMRDVVFYEALSGFVAEHSNSV